MLRLLIKLVLLAIITALAVKFTYMQRGYFAVGGEWLLWIWPVLWISLREEDSYEH